MRNKKRRNILSKIKAVGIDLDGVVYAGNKLMLGADKALQELRSIGKKVFFITNNSAKHRRDIVKKLNDLGVQAQLEEVFTSGYIAGIFLKRQKVGQVFVIGSQGLKSELAELGLNVSADEKSPYLLVGLDTDFSYERITQGLRLALNGAILVACNRDSNFPVEGGKFLPGCGAMVAAIEAAAGRTVDCMIGKPEIFLLKTISRHYGYMPGEIAVIGDALGSDIAMAKKFGSPSIYINRNRASIQNKTGIKPDFIAQSLKEAVQLFREGSK